VLAHILLFAPVAAWPQLLAFAFAATESVLQGSGGRQEEAHVYMGASVVSAVARRIMSEAVGDVEAGTAGRQSDLWALERLSTLLAERVFVAGDQAEIRTDISAFVRAHALTALEQASGVMEARRAAAPVAS